MSYSLICDMSGSVLQKRPSTIPGHHFTTRACTCLTIGTRFQSERSISIFVRSLFGTFRWRPPLSLGEQRVRRAVAAWFDPTVVPSCSALRSLAVDPPHLPGRRRHTHISGQYYWKSAPCVSVIFAAILPVTNQEIKGCGKTYSGGSDVTWGVVKLACYR